MAKLSKTSVTVIILFSCVALVAGIRLLHRPRVPVSEQQYHQGPRSKGNPAAKVHIIEFIDFQCPACRIGASEADAITRRYPNDVFFELKYFPLKMHKHSFEAARYAECAARQGRFWPFEELLFERQNDWSGLTDVAPAFEKLAKEAGVDFPAMQTCLKNKSVDQTIHHDINTGKLLDVHSTPTYFINGEMVVGFRDLERVVQAKIKNVSATGE